MSDEIKVGDRFELVRGDAEEVSLAPCHGCAQPVPRTDYNAVLLDGKPVAYWCVPCVIKWTPAAGAGPADGTWEAHLREEAKIAEKMRRMYGGELSRAVERGSARRWLASGGDYEPPLSGRGGMACRLVGTLRRVR